MTIDWRWASHQPLLLALVRTVDIKFVLELGCGDHSTPIFASAPAELLVVDNDDDWLSRISSRFQDRPLTTFKHHDLGRDIQIGTKPRELSHEQLQRLSEDYRRMIPMVPAVSPNLLFVDQFTCCRTLSINALLPSFDILVYHDCEPAGVICYEYSFNPELADSYAHFTYKTPEVWTGLFIRRGLAIDMVKLSVEAMRESFLFARRFGLPWDGFHFTQSAPYGFPALDGPSTHIA